MSSKIVCFLVSNSTHLDIVDKLIPAFKSKGVDVHVIGDLSRKRYSGNLEEKLRILKQRTALEAINVSIVGCRLSFFRFWDELKLDRKFHKIFSQVHALITFTEGGVSEWIALGVAGKLGIPKNCIQWAITWEPFVYNELHKRDLSKPRARDLVISLIRSILGLSYKRMIYFGDGGADKIFVLGEYWRQQFIKHHNNSQKFVVTGSPSFEVNGCDIKKEKTVVLALGAGTSLYSDDTCKHLNKIELIYSVFSELNSYTDYKLLHKIHPRDYNTEKISELAKKYPRVEVVDNSKDIKPVLDLSEILITVRSTAGLEGLVRKVKVIVFDDDNETIGFDYSKHCLALKASDKSSLEIALKASKKSIFDKGNVKYFIESSNCSKKIVNEVKADLIRGAGGFN